MRRGWLKNQVQILQHLLRQLARGSASVERDAVELETSSRPSKQAKVGQPGQLMAVRDQHEDEELEFYFHDEEIYLLERYDNSIEDEDFDLQCGTFDK